MADPELTRQLGYIHRTLELIALLLSVLVVASGGIGVVVVGGCAILLLVGNAITRAFD